MPARMRRAIAAQASESRRSSTGCARRRGLFCRAFGKSVVGEQCPPQRETGPKRTPFDLFGF